MQISPPSFPLSTEEFQHALRSGRGRAIQHLRSHGFLGLEPLLIQACLAEPQVESYDPGDYASWLTDIAIDAGLADDVIDEILCLEAGRASIGSNDRQFYVLEFRREILLAFARKEVPRARETLYSLLMVYKEPETREVVIGASQIVELDGIEGLIYVATRIGRWLADDPDLNLRDEDDCGLWALPEAIGKDTGRAALKAASIENEDVARCLVHLVSTGPDPAFARDYREHIRSLAGPELISLAARHVWPPTLARYANSASLESVFDTMLTETSPELRKRLLLLFASVGVPRMDERLLEWLSPDGDLVAETAAALHTVQDSRLREVALAGLLPPRCDSRYLPLLTHNFQKGDQTAIECALQQVSADQAHTAAIAVLAIFERSVVPEAAVSMQWIFENVGCESCRLEALKQLCTLEAVPQWIREEAALDYYLPVRERVQD